MFLPIWMCERKNNSTRASLSIALVNQSKIFHSWNEKKLGRETNVGKQMKSLVAKS